MESISIQSYSAQLRIYSKGADPPKSIENKKEGETSPKTSSVSSDFQSQDGDSFSMSLEARIIQISLTHTDDGAASGNQLAGNLQVNSAQDPEGKGGIFGSGLVKSLLQSLGAFLGNDGSVTQEIPNEPDSERLKTKEQKHHHPMGNPEDVASKVLQHLQQEHQERGGSLQSFVDQVQNRMENRQAGRGVKPDGFNEFRMQVDTLIVSGLNSWSQSGGQGINLQA